MHILLTRPLEDCSEMIKKFQSLGHKVSHLPLLTIEKKNYNEITFSKYGGIIFYSANAIKFLNLDKIDKNILCFCVGEVTEKKAAVGIQTSITALFNPITFQVNFKYFTMISFSRHSVFKSIVIPVIVKIIAKEVHWFPFKFDLKLQSFFPFKF